MTASPLHQLKLEPNELRDTEEGEETLLPRCAAMTTPLNSPHFTPLNSTQHLSTHPRRSFDKTPSLTLPTPVLPRNLRITSVNLVSDMSFPTEKFSGRATFISIPKQKPFFPLYTFPTPPPSRHPDISPTSFQSVLTSSFHVLHSLNRCSRICLWGE